MDKKDVARLLEQIAAFLELKGENAFRIRAYQTAARAIGAFPGDLESALESGELGEVKGVGPATLEIVSEALATGHSRVLDELRTQIPAGLVDMMRISGLGVAKIRQIHRSLGIDSLPELEDAARDGRLANLPRFGIKTAQKILKALEFLKEVSEYKLLHHARAEAERLVRVFEELPGVDRAAIAGSVRRHCELIRDLDFVVQLEGSWNAVTDRLRSAAGASELLAVERGAATVRFGGGTVADVYPAARHNWGFQLVRATGNRAHVEALAQRAERLGLGWTVEGIVRDGAVMPCPTETDVYRALDLAFIPPELREHRGEIEAAARGSLPALVTVDDLRGFLHCHSDYSDGTSTIQDWAQAARQAGYEYLGITDHSGAAMYAGGLRPEDIERQHAEIDGANRRFDDFTLLKGVEVDILQDGELDYSAQVRASFDFIIASIHNRFGQSGEEMTERVLRAMDDPDMVILGHPTGRLLLSRDPYPLDIEAILEKAAQRNIAVEINADPQRLDLDWRLVRDATHLGVTISVGADAHSTAGMGNMDLGIGIARKGWLTADEILNTKSLPEFLDHVARRRGTS